MKIIRVGVDLAKNVFQVHGVDRNEKPVWQRKLKRDEWIKVLLDKIEPGCVIGMEACGGAHHWARLLQAKGYTVKLIAPQFVKPYVKSNKNDANDAEANSSGGKEKLLGISKRGDCYVRYLLIHGARSMIIVSKGKEDRLSQWVMRISNTRHPNVAAVAMANKTARIAWAMIRNGSNYQPELAAA